MLLYAAIMGTPLIGWAMLSAGGYPIQVTKGFVLPPILPHNLDLYAFLREVHTIVAFLFFALILAHLAAALVHGLIRKDGVLRSMTVGHPVSAKDDALIDEPKTADAVGPEGVTAQYVEDKGYPEAD